MRSCRDRGNLSTNTRTVESVLQEKTLARLSLDQRAGAGLKFGFRARLIRLVFSLVRHVLGYQMFEIYAVSTRGAAPYQYANCGCSMIVVSESI
jgi:hypothetical protein